MKPLIIVLALSIISGSQVFVLSDEPDSKQDQMWEEYATNLTIYLQEKGDIVQGSEFGAGLLGLLHGGFAQVSRHLHKLKTELPTELTKDFNLVVGVPTGVMEKGLKVLYEAWRRKGFDERLKSALDDLFANETLESPDAEPFLQDLIARTQQTNEKLNEELKHTLDKLRPYAQNVQSQVNEFQESVVRPIANHFTELFKQTVEKVDQVAKPYFDPLLKPLREHSGEFKKWVSDPVFPPEQ